MPAAAEHSHLVTLPNGLRPVAEPMPWRKTEALIVFISTGNRHEPRRQNGICHVVEYKAFNGTDARRASSWITKVLGGRSDPQRTTPPFIREA